jgi:O-antigen ligase
MVTFLPFALVTAFGRESTLRRSIGAVTSVAMLGVIVLTKSRAGMLGLAAMMVILILQAGRLRSSLMVALVLGSLLAIPAAPPNVWTRLSSIVNQDNDETGSREARKELMREGWLTFLRFPLTGVGAGQFQNYNPPDRTVMWHETHNVLLQVLAELGVAGGACFVFLMGCMVTALARTKRWLRRPAIVDAFGPRDLDRLRMHVMAGTAGFAGWFVCAQFASIGYYWTFYYLLAFVVIARDVTRARLRRVDLRVG